MEERNEEQPGDWRKNKRRDKRIAMRDPSLKAIDVSFFHPLTKLAVTVKNLVSREGERQFPASPISADVAVMLNQLRVTFELLLFVNADERRDHDPHYRHAYSFVMLPLLRTLIDGFYNITTLLDDPSKARVFRLSGYKRMLAALKADEDLYGDQKGWPEYIAQQKSLILIGFTADGFRHRDLNEKAEWELLGTYLRSKPADDTAHKRLMRRFIHGPWREYSEISHVTFRGARELFEFLNSNEAPHQFRPTIIERAERALAQHLGRAATVLLSAVTEIQAVYNFKGHDVNVRIHEMWRYIVAFPEAEEIYMIHYEALMKKSKIDDIPSQPL